MDKYDYIDNLKANLSDLSEDERISAINYYKELFEEAGSENEQDLIQRLGSPQELAANIIRESGMVAVTSASSENSANTDDKFSFEKKTNNTNSAKNKSNNDIILAIILIVATFPLWIGLVGAAFGIIIAIISVIFAVIVSLGAISISGIIVGIITLFTSPATGLIYIGIGLISTSIIFLCLVPFWKLAVRFANWLGGCITNLWNKFFGKNKKKEEVI